MTPWFGLHLPSHTITDRPEERLFAGLITQARAAEEAGFSLVTAMDHLYRTPETIGAAGELLRLIGG